MQNSCVDVCTVLQEWDKTPHMTWPP